MKRTLLTSLLLGLAFCLGYTQPKSAGAHFSWNKGGLQYEHWAKKGRAAFHSIAVSSDFDNFWNFGGNNKVDEQGNMGVFARYNYDFVLLNKDHGYAESRLFLGPGAIAGYVADKDAPKGIMGGIALSFGYELSFSRALEVSVSINPCWSGHLHNDENGQMKLSLYKNSLYHQLLPEFSIRYNFQNKQSKRPSKVRKAIWGVDMGYDTPAFELIDQYYISQDGYRVNRNDTGIRNCNNMHIMLSCGGAIDPCNILSGVAGYEGIGKNSCIIANARWMHYFSKSNEPKDCALFLADLGPSLMIDRNHSEICPALRICPAAGYRLLVENNIGLNLYAGLENYFMRPSVYENDVKVNPEDVGHSFVYLCRLKLSAIVQF